MFSSNLSTTFDSSCSASEEDGTPAYVALWQFVVSSSDGSSRVLSPHTVCRKGELAN